MASVEPSRHRPDSYCRPNLGAESRHSFDSIRRSRTSNDAFARQRLRRLALCRRQTRRRPMGHRSGQQRARHHLLYDSRLCSASSGGAPAVVSGRSGRSRIRLRPTPGIRRAARRRTIRPTRWMVPPRVDLLQGPSRNRHGTRPLFLRSPRSKIGELSLCRALFNLAEKKLYFDTARVSSLRSTIRGWNRTAT